ncbi:MAG: beta-ketoacyl-[acyl-carrier-protein] synthase family protein [Myxococcales bacterium]|nr:beta-ketoacyl-[acyl-carrier-protein] synthase family protein [Myxococcales bacterium]
MVTPVGVDVESTWRAVLAGENGVRPIGRFDATDYPVRFAAEVPVAGSGAPLKQALAVLALDEAIANILRTCSAPEPGPRLGVCIGSEAARPPLEWLFRASTPAVDEIAALAPHAPTRLIGERVGARGPHSTVSTACTSSSQAIGEAVLRIRRGEVDAMIAGGVDVLSEPLMVVGFAKLGALSTRNDAPERASRPFDLHRDGFVLGEGAGMLVLEERESAIRRGAPMLAEVTGYGCSCNAWRITDSPPDGRGAAAAMLEAIADAGLDPSDIGYINAHGTSTPQNDQSESQAIHRAFGGHRVPVSSTKGQMGHLVAACGAVEAILCIIALRDQVLPPTRNLATPDPACGDLDHVLQARPTHGRLRHTLTNAFGFGGSNGSLVFSVAE